MERRNSATKQPADHISLAVVYSVALKIISGALWYLEQIYDLFGSPGTTFFELPKSHICSWWVWGLTHKFWSLISQWQTPIALCMQLSAWQIWYAYNCTYIMGTCWSFLLWCLETWYAVSKTPSRARFRYTASLSFRFSVTSSTIARLNINITRKNNSKLRLWHIASIMFISIGNVY